MIGGGLRVLSGQVRQTGPQKNDPSGLSAVWARKPWWSQNHPVRNCRIAQDERGNRMVLVLQGNSNMLRGGFPASLRPVTLR